MVLTEQEIKDRYRVIRAFTASITGTEVVLGVEDAARELVLSHLEAVEGLKKLKKQVIKAGKTVDEIVRYFENKV